MLTTLIPPTVGHRAGRRATTSCTAPATCARASGTSARSTRGSFAQRVRDELLSQGAFYGMSRAGGRDARRRAASSRLDLASFATRAGAAALAAARAAASTSRSGSMHAPPLLFLDEPSTGLDPQSRANLLEHILDCATQHGTTIVPHHALPRGGRPLRRRVMVMDKGRVIADDTATRLKAELAGDVLTLGFASAQATPTARLAVVQASTDREVRARRTRPSRHADRARGRRAAARSGAGPRMPRASASRARPACRRRSTTSSSTSPAAACAKRARASAGAPRRPNDRAPQDAASVTTGAQR